MVCHNKNNLCPIIVSSRMQVALVSGVERLAFGYRLSQGANVCTGTSKQLQHTSGIKPALHGERSSGALLDGVFVWLRAWPTEGVLSFQNSTRADASHIFMFNNVPNVRCAGTGTNQLQALVPLGRTALRGTGAAACEQNAPHCMMKYISASLHVYCLFCHIVQFGSGYVDSGQPISQPVSYRQVPRMVVVTFTFSFYITVCSSR